jgi:hypothetical protein
VDNDGPNARHQHSHEDAEYRRVELITGRRRRRDWTAEEKSEILAESSRERGSCSLAIGQSYKSLGAADPARTRQR